MVFPSPQLILTMSLVLLVDTSTTKAATNCSSQTFSKNRIFKSCSSLPTLDSNLHWTYDPSNSSMNIAFVAPPAKPDGWIAWAINPKSQGMLGAQALIAYKGSNGKLTVNTYNITAYGPISPSKIAFEVWNTEAESSDGVMRIFASVALPGNSTSINHVWQVGSAVKGTSPEKHAMEPANLAAKGTLDLLKDESSGSAAGAPSAGGKSSSSPSAAASASINFVISFSIFCLVLPALCL